MDAASLTGGRPRRAAIRRLTVAAPVTVTPAFCLSRSAIGDLERPQPGIVVTLGGDCYPERRITKDNPSSLEYKQG